MSNLHVCVSRKIMCAQEKNNNRELAVKHPSACNKIIYEHIKCACFTVIANFFSAVFSWYNAIIFKKLQPHTHNINYQTTLAPKKEFPAMMAAITHHLCVFSHRVNWIPAAAAASAHTIHSADMAVRPSRCDVKNGPRAHRMTCVAQFNRRNEMQPSETIICAARPPTRLTK